MTEKERIIEIFIQRAKDKVEDIYGRSCKRNWIKKWVSRGITIGIVILASWFLYKLYPMLIDIVD